jgi:hypothetical protein
MAISLRRLDVRGLTVSLALLACACGSDDNKVQPLPDDNEGGAPAATPSYPPALGPEDCVVTTGAVTLSQPEGAAVWGGLVVLEFEVEGAKVDSFDIQLFDPSLDAWTNYYVSTQAMAQREDGTYLIAATPYISDANRDQELRLRVRPTQDGCPDADWTETSGFMAGDPLVGTQWTAQIPATIFSGQLYIQRTPIPNDTALPGSRLRLGDASLAIDFGKKGVFTQVLTLPLASQPLEPYDDCTLSLTFEGTYRLSLRQQYGGVTLSVSEQRLISLEGTTCEFPTIEQMMLSADDFDVRLNAFTQQGVSINYLPLLYTEPGAPLWQSSNFGQIFQELGGFLSYQTPDEVGNMSGSVYPQDLTLERQ